MFEFVLSLREGIASGYHLSIAAAVRPKMNESPEQSSGKTDLRYAQVTYLRR